MARRYPRSTRTDVPRIRTTYHLPTDLAADIRVIAARRHVAPCVVAAECLRRGLPRGRSDTPTVIPLELESA